MAVDGGYDDLVDNAITVELPTGLHLQVAAVADVIRSKQLTGRDKDVRALPEILDQARPRGLLD